MASKKQFLPLVLSTLMLILLFVNCMASSSADNLAEAHQHFLERCLVRAFDDQSSLKQNPATKRVASAREELDSIFCRDTFRVIEIQFKLDGFLPNEYIKALENVPKFKNNEAALNGFLCLLDPHNNYRGIPCPSHDRY
ncbi:hypothetical protein ACH5RR_003083 [Cinchona calisaya]|uniref:Uncharacterized protein n=1 Tax=Cinchona calisaya TaxID=153742 RepID=A0ABD3ATS4_9GENT